MTSSDTRPTYTFMDMEAALCVWEYLLEQRHFVEPDAAQPPGLHGLWEAVGTSSVRVDAIEIGAVIEGAYVKWQEANPDVEDWLDCMTFDWEIVPAIVMECETVSWDKLAAPPEARIFEILTALSDQARASLRAFQTQEPSK